MIAVVHSEGRAVNQHVLISSTLYIIQQDSSSAGSKECSCPCNCIHGGEAKLPAHNSGIWSTPEVVTDCSPGAAHAQLDSALAW